MAVPFLTRIPYNKNASTPKHAEKDLLSLTEFGARMRKEYAGPLMATDILIQWPTYDHVVLIERKYPPLGIAIPGGFAEHMQFCENAVKEANEETGLDVELYNPDRPFIYLAEDPREYITTAVFIGKGRGELRPKPEEDAISARSYGLDEIADVIKEGGLAFKHHEQILVDYARRHRRFCSIAQDEDHLKRLWSGEL